WLCAGIWLVVSVTVSTPPDCPCANPGPTWTGTRLCRFGRAKVFWPSPPYVVPISWNSVSFSEIGIRAPLQNAQPAGAKLPANIRISPTNGPDISASLQTFFDLLLYSLRHTPCGAVVYLCTVSETVAVPETGPVAELAVPVTVIVDCPAGVVRG